MAAGTISASVTVAHVVVAVFVALFPFPVQQVLLSMDVDIFCQTDMDSRDCREIKDCWLKATSSRKVNCFSHLANRPHACCLLVYLNCLYCVSYLHYEWNIQLVISSILLTNLLKSKEIRENKCAL